MRRPEGGSRRRGRDGEEQGLVVWDYHVVCVHVKHGSPCSARAGSDGSGCSEWFVWDLDTTLAFPTPASEYVQRALWAGRSFFLPLQDTYQRLYRVVSASNFFKLFASDRSHMRDTVTRNWIASPPSYPCITAEDGETNRLESYIQMSPVDTVDIGVICKDYTSRGSLSSLNLLSWKTLLSAHNFGVLLDEVGFCLLLGETR
ncbi:hypothetical protein CLOM_g6848 [Closterium sp. NIES-68]|nr:hypothetical protein CLOM_g6848 [Closterium sp. NIES-68]GJP72383.1 hypothetical protein CLOP_g3122 [Closterium sp. NIES-67]